MAATLKSIDYNVAMTFILRPNNNNNNNTVTHIFSVDYWRNIEMCVTGRSWSLKIVPFESLGMFLSVCLSVCPSVTFVDHVKTNKHSFKFFSQSGSQAILVFPYQTSWHYSDGDPPP